MALPQGPALPPVPKRLFSSPVNAYSGTSECLSKDQLRGQLLLQLQGQACWTSLNP